MDTPTEHHVWCNYWTRPVKDCKGCNGPTGYWARFPYDTTEELDGLMKKHFPNAIERK